MSSSSPLLGGRYRLLQSLGEGGMAVVHRGRDELLDRDVAIKVLRDQYAADPDFVRRFQQEARNAAALAHPNVAPIFDTGVDGDTQYIVMQLVDGPDLEEVLALRGRLPVAEALRIVVSTAEALAAAHERGIVHRDIKPGNILLNRDGEVRVVDFGIARALGDARTTNPGLLLGSVHYCSPEQVLGEPIGPPTDIFSLGVVLYELLTGVRPWDGPAAAAVALSRLREPPPPPSAVVPELPPALDDVVMRALNRAPGDRYPSARGMAEAIREWWRSSRRAGAVADPRQQAARRRAATGPLPVGGAMAASSGTVGAVGATGAVSAGAIRAGGIGAAALGGRMGGASLGGPGAAAGLRSSGSAANGGDVMRRPGGPAAAGGGGGTRAPGPPIGTVDDDDRRRRRRPIPLWLVPAGLGLLLVMVFAVASLLDGPSGGVAGQTGLPGAAVLVPDDSPETSGTPSATPTLAPSPTPPPSPTASPTPSPTPPPTPPPTPAPTPPPTAAPTPPPTAAPTPPPTPRPVTPAPRPPTGGPADTVARFYFLVAEGRFREAERLWTADMRERYPPDEYIDGRFGPTERIDLNRNEVVDQDDDDATVAVDLTEYRSDGDVRRYVGSWDLVLTGDGWRMDDPDF